nr:G protein-coupled receptor [Proales similis]
MESVANSTLVSLDRPRYSQTIVLILATLYTLIFVIGIAGNSLVIYVVSRRKSMQTVTNLFIMNLALSDILMCLLAVPFTPIAYFQDHWILGRFLCHLVSYSTGISVYVSTLTSLAIAIDRYFVIVHPFKPRMKLGVCVLLIAIVWLVSLSISLPLAIYMKLIKIEHNGQVKYQCSEAWPIPMSKRFFNLASYILQYLIPFTVISYSYIKIWRVLSNRTRPGTRLEQERENQELSRKKKTNFMLVAMVVIFAGCWMPLNCVHLLMEFNHNFNQNYYFSTVFFIAHVIAMSSTIYNPFLYAWLNDNFRKEFRIILPWLFRPEMDQAKIGDEAMSNRRRGTNLPGENSELPSNAQQSRGGLCRDSADIEIPLENGHFKAEGDLLLGNDD